MDDCTFVWVGDGEGIIALHQTTGACKSVYDIKKKVIRSPILKDTRNQFSPSTVKEGVAIVPFFHLIDSKFSTQVFSANY